MPLLVADPKTITVTLDSDSSVVQTVALNAVKIPVSVKDNDLKTVSLYATEGFYNSNNEIYTAIKDHGEFVLTFSEYNTSVLQTAKDGLQDSTYSTIGEALRTEEYKYIADQLNLVPGWTLT